MMLHPGAAAVLKRVDGNELDIARMIRDGELASPQRYVNMWLYAMRVTGTEVSYRPQLDEWVWRRPENYLHDDFLARIAGLPVIMRHPETPVLDSEEFLDRIVGTVMLPYIKGDEVWAICRIYVDEAVELLQSEQMSTSPNVVLGKSGKLKLEDGSKLLIEGEPTLIDHLAICKSGVWDKGGAPTGVEADVRKDENMADDDKAKADAAARADAEKRMDEKLDMILHNISDSNKRMDALGARMDAAEEREKEREDSAKKDAAKRKDQEDGDEELKSKKDARKRSDDDDDEFPPPKEEKKDKRKDAAKRKDDDDEEEEEKGKARELAADKAKKDAKRKDDDDDKERCDDDDDDAKKKDSARADENKSLRRIVADQAEQIKLLLARTAPSEGDVISLEKLQAKADAALIEHGRRAPRFMAGENPDAYRRRLLNELKTYSKAWKDVDLAVLKDQALENVEGHIYADASVAARTPSDIGDGMMRAIERRTSAGHTIVEWQGGPGAHFVKKFTRATIKPRTAA